MNPVRFELPFPVEISPDLENARRHHQDWMTARGLVGTNSAWAHSVERYRSYDLPALAALVWPYATGSNLELACDVVGWTLAFDDWFEDAGKHEQGASRDLLAQLLAVLTGASSSGVRAGPLVCGFADIWARCIAGMAPSWRHRHLHNWEYYLCANQHEVTDRMHGIVPDFDHYLQVRRGTVCLESYLDLAERFGGFTLTPAVYHIPSVRLMRQITTLVPALTNDVVTLPKEESVGEVNNLVLVLEHGRRCGRDEAIAIARQLIDDQVARFVELAAEAHDLCERYSLPSEEQQSIDRHVRAQQLWMGGFEEWSHRTERYSKQNAMIGPNSRCVSR